MTTIQISNGRLIDPKSGTDAKKDVFIADGRIVAIGRAPAGFQPGRVIDAAGLVVAPGFVDLSARLREPGFEHKATLESEMQAAVAGGVAHLAIPPDTEPPLDEPGLVQMLKYRARGLHLAHVHPLGALTQGLAGERLTEMVELTEAGCVAFSQANVAISDSEVLWRAMQYASTFAYTVWLRPQDAFLSKLGVAHDGEVATRLGLPGIQVFAETIAIATILELVRATGTRVHLARLSSGAGVGMVRAAKMEGLPVSCDVGAHHVHLSDMDLGYYDAQCHLVPPLRSRRDRDALRAGLADGTVDAICSDHTPVDEDEKLLPFGESTPGATGLELLLPLTLKWASESKLSFATALARITCDPARILGIAAGELAVDRAADVCVFDAGAQVMLSTHSLKSQGKNTPFLGYELPGKVRYTLVDGAVVYEA